MAAIQFIRRRLECSADQHENERATPAPAGFAVVGLGASAGGLAALEAFFSAMPSGPESGIAYVLVQHLASGDESLLSDLVQRYTRMHVCAVENGMPLEPNGAYIIPPHCDLHLLEGALTLSVPARSCMPRFPIDALFRSLALARGDRAVGVVLSGTGTDGTLGARAIKARGGIVLAQSPESARYDGMPRSVIASGLADHVLPPAEMPAQLMAHASARSGAGLPPSVPPPPVVQDELVKIVASVYAHTGQDFSQYKQSTIRRRVERRMALQQIEQLSRYRRYLDATPGEADALLRDLLIGVTSFFRDPAAFAALEAQLVLQLLGSRSSTIRVWVPACSSGEEAYSIAMLLYEAAQPGCTIRAFASDIDPRAIQVARAGEYPASIARDVGAERLARHFSPAGEGRCRVRTAIRELLLFSEQDVTRDPPFSRLDLISCRNLMIYLSAALQRKLIPLFHYALKPGGMLFLGTSETVGEFVDLFSAADRQAKLYRRRDDACSAAGFARGPARSAAQPAGAGLSLPQSDRAREPELGEGAEWALPVLAADPAPAAQTAPVEEDARVLALWQELRKRDECAHAAREEMQTSNEEFRASLEQLQSANEQLQSTNEQLETSKEQIHAMNRQLAIVNAELKSKVADLARVNDDMSELLAGTGAGTLFVDRASCIRSFTSGVTRFVRLVPSDVGRPLRELESGLVEQDRLAAEVQSVLDAVSPGRADVRTRAGVRCLLRIRPYRTAEDTIEGAVITFTELKIAKEASVAFPRSTLVEPECPASTRREMSR